MSNKLLKFVLDKQVVEIDFQKETFHPSTTVLNYLRSLPHHRGVKEGCAEGDCGACTVVLGELTPGGGIRYRAIDSCLLFLPAIHGKQLITVENLSRRQGTQTLLHPVQQAMVDQHGSQCGFCTPGFVMALFAFYKTELQPTRENLVDAMAGNLCRCTGYQPIINAAVQCCEQRGPDHFDQQEAHIIQLLKQIHSQTNSLDIRTANQHYMLPRNLDEALGWRAEFPDATVVAGATDTAIRQNKTHEFAPAYIDLSQVSELQEIREEENGYFLGAGVSIERLKAFSKEHLPAMMPMLEVFASLQIREVATLGGNLATASPIGDLIPLFFALKARMELGYLHQKRIVDAESFITGYRKNCLKPGELLLGVHIPKPGTEVVLRTEKVSTRRDLDISTVCMAMRLIKADDDTVKEILLAYGGMAERTRRAANTEKFLLGKSWNEQTIEAAVKVLEADFTPISDARGGSRYRMLAAQNILLKVLAETSANPENTTEHGK